ncbi:hypothetical protein KFL01_28140 [Kocuria flava]|uniref:Uncharacterized protein n=1 Tax=Kocuria flava TaxID=446860 RepID=A0ABQ0X9R9_9MICC|nr:hypothetical protein KFL01_28140 [Kocuria flava]
MHGLRGNNRRPGSRAPSLLPGRFVWEGAAELGVWGCSLQASGAQDARQPGHGIGPDDGLAQHLPDRGRAAPATSAVMPWRACTASMGVPVALCPGGREVSVRGCGVQCHSDQEAEQGPLLHCPAGSVRPEGQGLSSGASQAALMISVFH